MDEGSADRPAIKAEQRRASRFPVVVPVDVQWQELSGKTVKEAAQAKEVNAQGGLLDMKNYPGISRQLELTNLLSGESAEARIVALRRSKQGAVVGVAVELLVPNEAFGGVNFQLKKTTAELAKIEQAIKSGGVEPSILREFRDAVDYLRKTAWAVPEWQERQLQQHDPQAVLPLLIIERIRRATQLNKAITTDLATRGVTRETTGIDEFFRTVESLYQRVVDLFRDHHA
jgi:hypothetical protein